MNMNMNMICPDEAELGCQDWVHFGEFSIHWVEKILLSGSDQLAAIEAAVNAVIRSEKYKQEGGHVQHARYESSKSDYVDNFAV
jgi:hypothetical protein